MTSEIETRVTIGPRGLAAAHAGYREAVRSGQVNRGAGGHQPSADMLRRRARLVLSQMRDRGLTGTRQYHELLNDFQKLTRQEAQRRGTR